jgi:hypothetical protein
MDGMTTEDQEYPEGRTIGSNAESDHGALVTTHRLDGGVAPFEAMQMNPSDWAGRLVELERSLVGWMTHCENQERRIDKLEARVTEFEKPVVSTWEPGKLKIHPDMLGDTMRIEVRDFRAFGVDLDAIRAAERRNALEAASARLRERFGSAFHEVVIMALIEVVEEPLQPKD